MSASDGTSIKNVSLYEIVALAEEIAALARMGIPLERGLTDVAHDLAGRDSRLTLALAERLRAGQTLVQALGAEPAILPPAYRAIVEAGIRSGRLTSALEGLASSARKTADLRRMTRAALPYPILVALMAYGMFLFSVTGFQPLIARAYETMHMPADRVNSMLLALGHSAALWGPLVPFAVLVPLAIWWHRSRRATFGTTSILRAMPSQRMADYGRMATFAEVLSLLVDHEVPLDESIRLAAEASGDSRLQSAACEMALDVEQGRAQHVLRDTSATLPPLMRWLLAGRASRPELAAALHRMAETYRRRAERLDERLRLFLPIALSLGIGGTAVILYALSVLVPWYTMLWELPQAPH